MTTQPPIDLPVQASMRLPESLWKRAKIEAIQRGITVADYVKGLLEQDLTAKAKKK